MKNIFEDFEAEDKIKNRTEGGSSYVNFGEGAKAAPYPSERKGRFLPKDSFPEEDEDEQKKLIPKYSRRAAKYLIKDSTKKGRRWVYGDKELRGIQKPYKPEAADPGDQKKYEYQEDDFLEQDKLIAELEAQAEAEKAQAKLGELSQSEQPDQGAAIKDEENMDELTSQAEMANIRADRDKNKKKRWQIAAKWLRKFIGESSDTHGSHGRDKYKEFSREKIAEQLEDHTKPDQSR